MHSRLIKFARKEEYFWGNEGLKRFPHYKYVLRPLYKSLGGKENPLISVPLTFAAADILFHQPVDKWLHCTIYNDACPEIFTMKNLAFFLFWMALSIPITYLKYYRNCFLHEQLSSSKISNNSSVLFTKPGIKTVSNDNDVEDKRDYRINPRRSERLRLKHGH